MHSNANMLYLQTSICIHLLPSTWTTKRLTLFHNRKKILGKCLSTDRTYKSKPRIDNRREGDMLLHVIDMYIGLVDSLDPEIATHPSYHSLSTKL